MREAGAIPSRALLVAIGINWEGRRNVLAVELANRESHSSWRRGELNFWKPLIKRNFLILQFC